MDALVNAVCLFIIVQYKDTVKSLNRIDTIGAKDLSVLLRCLLYLVFSAAFLVSRVEEIARFRLSLCLRENPLYDMTIK